VGHVERWTFQAPAVSSDLILRLQKYRVPATAPAAIREAAEAVAAEARRLATPEAVLWRGPLFRTTEPGTVLLGGTGPFRSRALARLLARSEEAWVLVLTVGGGIEERARAMFQEGQLLESFLMDTAGWAAIEVLARDVRGRLLALERVAGRSVTHRLGPGHGDWDLAEHPALLQVFGGTDLPVRLNEAACMLPQKSISAVFGVIVPDAPL